MAACSAEQAQDGPSQEDTRPSQALIAHAGGALPEDVDLAAIYQRSCMMCHARLGTGAPLTGNAAEWSRRKAQGGIENLLNSTKRGINAMPAMGLCADCSDDQLIALIAFMAKGPDE